MSGGDGRKGHDELPIRISTAPAARGHETDAPWVSAMRGLEEPPDPEEKKQPRLGIRLTLTGIVVLGLFTVMLGRLWSLQILQTQSLKKAEINTSTRDVPLTPSRGLIYARGGQLLVGDEVLPVVTLDRTAAVDDKFVIPRLAALLKMSIQAVNHQITDDQYSVYAPIPIAGGPGETPVSLDEVLYISEHRSVFPGVSVSYQYERSYPLGSVVPELLGFVGDITSPEYAKLKSQGYQLSDVVGQFGVESEFESWLRGSSGTQVVVVDPQGDVLRTQKTTPAKPGDSIVLTLDLGLQRELDSALAAQIKKLRAGSPGTPGVPADWGAAVVLDPQNGDVLAMSSVPNTQTYAISGLSTPGSTFKLVTATAALDSGLISPYSEINDNGSLSLCNGPGCVFYNSPGESPLGPINVSSALSASDDVFFYNLGYDFYLQAAHYGKTPIQNTAAEYGLGVPSGIDTPGEASGLVDGPNLYNGVYPAGDQVEMAFGQGETEVTALQLANEYATFANGGTRYVPQVAAAVVNSEGKIVKRFAAQVAGHVSLPSATQQAILAGLEGAVGRTCDSCNTHVNGTAAGTFAGFPMNTLPIAGKTGTATTAKPQPNGLFVAFGPTTDPQYVVAVIIDQAGYGADTAAPVARQVFQYLIHHPVQPFVVPSQPNG